MKNYIIFKILINGPQTEVFDPLPAVLQWLSEDHESSGDITMTDENTGLVPGSQPPIEKVLNENPGKNKWHIQIKHCFLEFATN